MENNFWDNEYKPKTVMEEVQRASDHMLELYQQMLDAEESYNKAREAYESFSRNELPTLFRNNGLDLIRLSNGKVLRIDTCTKCSLNKNDTDKANVSKWLKEHGGASLVKSQFIVTDKHAEELKEAGIEYEEDVNINTNQVKSFLLELLGQKGSPARINMDEIPHGVNFFQYEEAHIDERRI